MKKTNGLFEEEIFSALSCSPSRTYSGDANSPLTTYERNKKRKISTDLSDTGLKINDGNESTKSVETYNVNDKVISSFDKKERRKIRNRISAQQHRQRQKNHVENLEKLLDYKNTEIWNLTLKLQILTKEHEDALERLRLLEETAVAVDSNAEIPEIDLNQQINDLNIFDNDFQCLNNGSDHFHPSYLIDSYVSSEQNSGSISVHDETRYDRKVSADNQSSDFHPNHVWNPNLDELESDLIMLDLESSRIPHTDEEPAENSEHDRSLFVSSRNAVSITAFGILFMFTFFSKIQVPFPVLPSSSFVPRISSHEGDSNPHGRVLRDSDMNFSGGSFQNRAGEYKYSSLFDEVHPCSDSACQEIDRRIRPSHSSWIFSPKELSPSSWRSTSARKGNAPWVYKRALDLFGSGHWQGLPLVSKSINDNSDIKKPIGEEDQFYSGTKDIDIYRGSKRHRSAGHADGNIEPDDKSYMFCPATYGIMSPRVITEASRVLSTSAKTHDSSDDANSLAIQEYKGNLNFEVDSMGSEQYLSLLVPNSFLDWGKLHSHINLTSEVDGEGWLEVSCQITNIRLVQDVSFAV